MRTACAFLIISGLVAPLAIAQRVEAQFEFPPSIHLPFAAPDLVLTMTAPEQVQSQFGQIDVSIRVDNLLTPVGRGLPGAQPLGGSEVDDVFVVVHFAGLEPQMIQGDSGFQCGLAGGGGTVPPTYAMCTGGKIPAGGTATITLRARERGNCTLYCGPVYTDARVGSYKKAERSRTNNRAVAATDVVNCIN